MPAARTTSQPLGVVYTPPEVARAMTRLALAPLVEGRSSAELLALRICDPAAGTGAFLVEVVAYLAEHLVAAWLREGLRPEPDRDAARALVAATCIAGVDVDELALTEAHRAISLDPAAASLDLAAPDLAAPEREPPLRQADALTLDWRAAFPATFARGGFDVVIANPPYIRQESLGSASAKARLESFEVYDGVADLYVYFLELAHRIVRPGGRYCVIVPSKWLTVEYGRPLRAFLSAAHSIDGVVDLSSHALFAGADAFPCIVWGTLGASPARALVAIRALATEGVAQVLGRASGRVSAGTATNGATSTARSKDAASSSNDAASNDAASNDAASNDAASNDAASNDAASNDAASNDAASNDAASNDAASNDAASNAASSVARSNDAASNAASSVARSNDAASNAASSVARSNDAASNAASSVARSNDAASNAASSVARSNDAHVGATSLLVPRERWTADPWHIDSATDRFLLERLARVYPTLGEVIGTRWSRGVVTGLNAAFVIDRATRDALIAADAGCAAWIRPFVKGRDIRPFSTGPIERWIVLVDRGTSFEALPAPIREHLARFRSRLEPRPSDHVGAWPGRKPGAYAWHELQDPVVPLARSREPRLLYQDIQTAPACSFDPSGELVPDTTVWILPSRDRYLLAVLNSRLYGWYAQRRFPPALNGAVRPKLAYMQQLPIPVPSRDLRHEIEALVERRLTIPRIIAPAHTTAATTTASPRSTPSPRSTASPTSTTSPTSMTSSASRTREIEVLDHQLERLVEHAFELSSIERALVARA